LLPSLRGQIKVSAGRLALTSKLAAQDARGVLRIGDDGASFEDLEGAIAGGRLSGMLVVQPGADGLATRAVIHIAGAEIGELLTGDTRSPLAGRLTLDADVAGTGRSAVATIGSLKGTGTFTLQDGRVSRLDPAAFDAVMRSVDLGLPIETVRIRDRIESALANGSLGLLLAEGAMTISAGQARIAGTTVRGQGADLAVTGGIDLATGALDSRLTLSGPPGKGAPGSGRPEISIALKGPLDAPRRTLDVSVLSSWLALRAVEEQAKRLDALESGRSDPSPNLQTPAPTPPPPRATGSTGAGVPRPAQPRTPPAAEQAPLDLRPPAARPPRAEGAPPALR
jgi:large subunit ribosomal protein L24